MCDDEDHFHGDDKGDEDLVVPVKVSAPSDAPTDATFEEYVAALEQLRDEADDPASVWIAEHLIDEVRGQQQNRLPDNVVELHRRTK